MAKSKLHIICGNCGESENFEWGYRKEQLLGDGELDCGADVFIACKSCSTIHSLNDNAEIEGQQMATNKNGIHHVINKDLGNGKFLSFCNRIVFKYDMPIDLEHAKACIEQGAYWQPCKKCMTRTEIEEQK